ncbi:MAG: aminopeptidase P family protein [Alphaproteobacteria bacterium]|nr:aminopeptidase P family protein [Alphaproteobacteria bacterium]
MIHLKALQEWLVGSGLSGFILPRTDAYLNEFIPARAERLRWLTGFTGSAGVAVVFPNKAALLTDGRYTLQARQEVNGCEIIDSTKTTLAEYLAAQGSGIFGYDPALHTRKDLKAWEDKAEGRVTFNPLVENPIDALWNGQPEESVSPVRAFPERIAGLSAAQKIVLIRQDMKGAHVQAVLITRPDSVCWLLNVRGADVPYTPLVLSRLLLMENSCQWFIAPQRVPQDVRAALGAGVTIRPPEELEIVLRGLGKEVVLGLDPARTSLWFYQQTQATIKDFKDPCIDRRAIKTQAEQESMREVHRRDGQAVAALLRWARESRDYDENDVARKSEVLRRDMANDFVSLSFPTIAGFNANGAIIHYRPPEAGSARISGQGLLLIDSGAQYEGGTTDVTRTIAIGPPTAEQMRHYTLVLKAHIAVASARFPEGTTGAQIDALARHVLWQAGLDYAHGTGHGVGVFLSVHEEAASLSPRGQEAVKPGMILSNEPGYYQEGAYGIRIENLILCVETGETDALGRKILAFEDLSLVPYDHTLIDERMLSAAEKEWLAAYEARLKK